VNIFTDLFSIGTILTRQGDCSYIIRERNFQWICVRWE